MTVKALRLVTKVSAQHRHPDESRDRMTVKALRPENVVRVEDNRVSRDRMTVKALRLLHDDGSARRRRDVPGPNDRQGIETDCHRKCVEKLRIESRDRMTVKALTLLLSCKGSLQWLVLSPGTE